MLARRSCAVILAPSSSLPTTTTTATTTTITTTRTTACAVATQLATARLYSSSSSSSSSSSGTLASAEFTAFLQSGYDETTAFYRGTRFEYESQEALGGHGFELERLGGTGDEGVDLRGQWLLNSSDGGRSSSEGSLSLPVVAQCKLESKPIGTRHLREFEGVLAREAPGVLGVFLSGSGYTAPASKLARSPSAPPLLLAVVEPRLGLTYAALNTAAFRLAPGLRVATQLTPSTGEGGGDGGARLAPSRKRDPFRKLPVFVYRGVVIGEGA